jgi:predicted transcriptional regulator
MRPIIVANHQLRESFKQEAAASWSDYLATGQHVTAQEIRAWLNKWGTEAETEVPACHAGINSPSRVA